MPVFDWLRSLFASDLDDSSRVALEWWAKKNYQEYWETYQKMLPYKTDTSGGL